MTASPETRHETSIPSWVRVVMMTDHIGTTWYLTTSLLFAPGLAVLSPWPTARTALWIIIGFAGLALGLLGIALTVGLALVFRSGIEIPQHDWEKLARGGWLRLGTTEPDHHSNSTNRTPHVCP